MKVAVTDAPRASAAAAAAQATAAAVSAAHVGVGIVGEALSARMAETAARLTSAAAEYTAEDTESATALGSGA